MSQPALPDVLARLDARINWERRKRQSGWRVDLEPMRDLAGRLGRPERSVQVVHVTGSKGKGSVSSLIAQSLIRAGARVGVYSSPHVERLNERIRIQGDPIDDRPLARAVERALAVAEAARAEESAGADASWFDVVTAAALEAFRAAAVDWVVLEVGLGGRLDSTNVVERPEACVVTTIELEHTAILGDTRGAIATEKGGIFKRGALLVTGCAPVGEASDALRARALAVGGELVHAHDEGDRTFEERNIRTAQAVLGGLAGRGFCVAPLTQDAVTAARLPGRMEARKVGDVDVVLDGAHVASSVEVAVREACTAHPGPFAAVVAVHSEKDLAAILEPLRGASRLFATTVPDSGVHREPEDVAAAGAELGLEVEAYADPGDALRGAASWAQAGAVAAGAGADGQPAGASWVLVLGSLYLVGALRSGTTRP